MAKDDYRYGQDLVNAPLPKRMKLELNSLFGQFLKYSTSKTRISRKPNSTSTQEKKCRSIINSLVDLRNGGFALETLYNFKEKHVEYLVSFYVEQGEARGTIENKLSYLRAVSLWIKKPNLVKDTDQYEAILSLPARSGSAQEDLSAEGKNVDVEELLSKVMAMDIFVGTQLLLQWAFGLRVKESMMLRPHDCLTMNDGRRQIFVNEGTKGGRARFVLAEDDKQAECLEFAKKYVNGKTGSTIPSTYTREQWRNHYYYVVGKCGISRKGLGMTSHGLRHGFLQKLYQQITGLECAVKGGEKPADDVLEKAKKVIVESAGHSAPYKANAYLGSPYDNRRKYIASITVEAVQAALDECNNVRDHAIKKLNIPRDRFYALIKEIDKKVNSDASAGVQSDPERE